MKNFMKCPIARSQICAMGCCILSKKEGKSLSLIIMDAMVKAYGYKDIDDAERQQKIRTMSNI